ncbi:unnamed protein product [Cochlearia groenlandica]
MRRGGVTNRFSKKQSGSEFAAKSKKIMFKKIKKHEMVCDFSSSNLEIEVSMNKSKLLKKSNNGVDHASVPRKLRSAMKKRNLESVSKLSSKRLNRSKTEIESFKKENQIMEAKAIVLDSMTISKDEKEVVETLYGLAGMFKETNTINNNTCCVSLYDKKQKNKVVSSLVIEADFRKTESLEHAVSVPSSDKTNVIDVMTLDQSHSNLDRLTQTSSVRAIEIKVETSDMSYKNNGLALWPGLSSMVQHGSHGLSKPSSTTYLPHWMGQAVVSTSKNASHSSEPVRVKPRKLKKCASHIYISHLIKALQNNKSSHINQNHQRSSSEHVLLDPKTTITDLKTMVTPSQRHQNMRILDINRTHCTKPMQEDMNKLSFDLYGPHTSHNQNYDFLTLASSREVSQSHSSRFPTSTTYNSHQVQQISPYLATTSRFQTSYNANQQQHLQKKLWSGQYRNGYTVMQPSNQYSKPNLSLNLTSSTIQQQPLHVVASSTRYSNNVSQHQHRLMASSAMSMNHHHNIMNRQEQRFPLIYEDTRHRFSNYSAANSREDALLYS